MNTFIKLASIILFLLVIASCEKKDNDSNEPKTYKDYSGFISDGLVAYYSFNGDANDLSGNNNNGIIYGPTPSVDRFNDTIGSYLFDGVDDFIEIPNSTELNSNEGTICLWVRIPYSDENFERVILSKADTSRNGFTVTVFGAFSFYFTTRDPDTQIEHGIDIGGDFWFEKRYFFIAVAYTETSTVTYFEGERRNSSNYSPEMIFNNNDQTLYIGKSLISSYGYFKGEIDDLVIYDRALTDAEILQLYDWQ